MKEQLSKADSTNNDSNDNSNNKSETKTKNQLDDPNYRLKISVQNGDINETQRLLVHEGADVNYAHAQYRFNRKQLDQYTTVLAIALCLKIKYQDNHDDNDNQNSQDDDQNDYDYERNNYGNNNNSNCKHIKSQAQYLQMINLLLKYGADPNFRNNKYYQRRNNKTIMHRPIIYIKKLKSQQNKIKFIQIFMKYVINISNQTLLFDVMDIYNGFKMKQLSKMCENYNFNKEVINKDQRMFQKYCQFYGLVDQQYQMYIQRSARTQQRTQQNTIKNEKIVQFDIIKTIIKNGNCSNATKSQHRDMSIAEQQNPDRYSSDSLQQLSQDQDAYIDRGFKNEKQTVLHRAIMYNSVQLVKFLIDNGADPNISCVCSILQPVYPHQWGQKVRNVKIMKNLQYLKYLLQQKQYIMESIQKTNEIQNILRDRDRDRRRRSNSQQKRLFNANNFKIFKAQCFKIENQLPQYTYSSCVITCMQLAEMFKASEQIITILKQYLQI